ncbi:MAG: hypothetical protein EZS28_003119 [Streblomastix strix]|uniref:Homeobox domain-containing protein n=1 Tax=Streblomastix strix TaxID=222440 RepID=A0A5J4X263_9EUKA|nr:MAG: hypothetical protein EZS28_003119 [Streblomastix strix]
MVEDNETFRTKGPFSDEIREKLNNFLIYNPTSNPTIEQKKMIEQQCGLNSHQIDNFFATLRYRLKRRHTPRYLNLPLLNKKQGNRSKKGTSKRVASKSEQQKGSNSGNQRENNINNRSVSTNSSSHTNQDKRRIDEDEDIDSTLISSYMVYPGNEPESTQIAEEQRARLAALVVFGPYKRKQSARDFIHAMSLDLKMDGEDED